MIPLDERRASGSEDAVFTNDNLLMVAGGDSYWTNHGLNSG
jgi:hypothetical protein